MTSSCLIDTNILVYAFNENSEFHNESLNFLNASMSGKITACISYQSLFEFYAVVTDSRKVQFPAKPEQAISALNTLINSNIQILYPNESVINKVFELLITYNIKRQMIFDIMLISIMSVNNIENVITYNIKDFEFVKNLNVLTQKDIDL